MVSLVVDASASRGLVAVRDNGVGMTPQVRAETLLSGSGESGTGNNLRF